MKRARMHSHTYRPAEGEMTELWSAVTRRDGAAFAHNAAGFVQEHRRNAARWDLAAIAGELNGSVGIHIGGSAEDPYEPKQMSATRIRVPEAELIEFPGGHLVTAEHPELLAARIREIAVRYGVQDGEPSHSRGPTP